MVVYFSQINVCDAFVLQSNIQIQQEHKSIITPSKDVNEEAEHQDTERPELHKADDDTGPPQETGPATEHPVEVEEEHKKELEEEEMEQVGKPERLVEEQDQVQEEQEQHRQSDDEHRAAANEEEEGEADTHILQGHEKVRNIAIGSLGQFCIVHVVVVKLYRTQL